MKKIKAQLQKMKYAFYGDVAFECICLVDKSSSGGEFTLCGHAIPDSSLEFLDFESVGEEFSGSIKDVTCPECLRKIEYIKSLK